MAKNEEKKNTNRMIDTQMQRSIDKYSAFQPGLLNDVNQSRTQNAGLTSQLQDIYSNPQNMMGGIKPNSSGWYDLPDVGGGGSAFDSTGDFAKARTGYEDFAATGGISSGDVRNLRDRATSKIPAFYNQVRNDMNRRRSIQGGYSPGFDDAYAESVRAGSRGAYEASRDAEAGIVGMRNQGKMAGLGGLTGIGNAAQQNSIANAGFADSAANRRAQMQMGLLGMQNQNAQFGATGLSNLRTQGADNTAIENYLQSLGQGDQSGLGYLGARVGNQGNGTDWWQRAMGGIGAGAGIAAAYYGSR
jgi:hypothetical protein